MAAGGRLLPGNDYRTHTHRSGAHPAYGDQSGSHLAIGRGYHAWLPGGGLVGYGVGMALYQSVGTWFIESMGMQSSYESFQAFFDQYGFVAILALGIVPVPFQIAMITAGVSGYPIYLFVLAALIARGIRYYGLAWLILRFGAQAEYVWRRHAVSASLAAAGALVAISLGMQALADRLI